MIVCLHPFLQSSASTVANRVKNLSKGIFGRSLCYFWPVHVTTFQPSTLRLWAVHVHTDDCPFRPITVQFSPKDRPLSVMTVHFRLTVHFKDRPLSPFNPFPQIPETKSRLREPLEARFLETKSGVKNENLISGISGSAFSGNKIRTDVLGTFLIFLNFWTLGSAIYGNKIQIKLYPDYCLRISDSKVK